jgi:hypothetical protein
MRSVICYTLHKSNDKERLSNPLLIRHTGNNSKSVAQNHFQFPNAYNTRRFYCLIKGQIPNHHRKLKGACRRTTHMKNTKWPNPDAIPKSGSAGKSTKQDRSHGYGSLRKEWESRGGKLSQELTWLVRPSPRVPRQGKWGNQWRTCTR